MRKHNQAISTPSDYKLRKHTDTESYPSDHPILPTVAGYIYAITANRSKTFVHLERETEQERERVEDSEFEERSNQR